MNEIPRFYIDSRKIVRWNHNAHVPFDDVLTELYFHKLITEDQLRFSRETRRKEQVQFISEFRELLDSRMSIIHEENKFESLKRKFQTPHSEVDIVF